jgi:hypothetical protein
MNITDPWRKANTLKVQIFTYGDGDDLLSITHSGFYQKYIVVRENAQDTVLSVERLTSKQIYEKYGIKLTHN